MSDEIIAVIIVQAIGLIAILIAGAFYVGRRDKAITDLAKRLEKHEEHCTEREGIFNLKMDHNIADVAEIKGDMKVLSAQQVAIRETFDYLRDLAKKA